MTTQFFSKKILIKTYYHLIISLKNRFSKYRKAFMFLDLEVQHQLPIYMKKMNFIKGTLILVNSR